MVEIKDNLYSELNTLSNNISNFYNTIKIYLADITQVFSNIDSVFKDTKSLFDSISPKYQTKEIKLIYKNLILIADYKNSISLNCKKMNMSIINLISNSKARFSNIKEITKQSEELKNENSALIQLIQKGNLTKEDKFNELLKKYKEKENLLNQNKETISSQKNEINILADQINSIKKMVIEKNAELNILNAKINLLIDKDNENTKKIKIKSEQINSFLKEQEKLNILLKQKEYQYNTLNKKILGDDENDKEFKKQLKMTRSISSGNMLMKVETEPIQRKVLSQSMIINDKAINMLKESINIDNLDNNNNIKKKEDQTESFIKLMKIINEVLKQVKLNKFPLDLNFDENNINNSSLLLSTSDKLNKVYEKMENNLYELLNNFNRIIEEINNENNKLRKDNQNNKNENEALLEVISKNTKKLEKLYIEKEDLKIKFKKHNTFSECHSC